MADKLPKVGSRVEIVGKDVRGKVAFVGSTNFSPGKWFGVVLDEPKGKNNGCVQGKVYFTCPENHGLFVRQTQIIVIEDDCGIKGRASSATSSGSMENINTPAKDVADRRKRSSIGTGIPAGSMENINTPAKDVADRRKRSSIGTGIPASSMENISNSAKDTSDKRKKSSLGTGIPRFPSDKGAKDAANLAETPSRMSNSLRSSMVQEDILAHALDLESIKNTSAALEFKGQLLQKDQEIENLKHEIKDLSEKLETLKIKRQDDQGKIKEAEKTKIQVQQLLEYKTKIAEVQADLQRQLTVAKKEAKDAIEAKEQHAEEMSDLAEAMELATLDKEMAEEKNETLLSELEQTKEKLEELQLDYEIMKTEMSDKGGDGAATTYKVKQLEQQNERLKEALVKMRDLSAHEKQEHQMTTKEIDQQKSEIAELSRAKEKLSILVEDYEKQLGELKEQVDAALGCEEMVEHLTERNLALEDRVRELQLLVDDLERLQDVNDQLQETAKETELELHEEVDMANAKILEGVRKLEATQEAIADYEQTIQKFREQTEHLRDANHELQMQLQKESDRIAMATPVEFFDFKVKYAENKAFARAVEMDLRRLEVQEANQHVSYLCAFMSDNFLTRGSDHDAILVLLLIPRMITKVEILCSQVKEKFPSPEKITQDIVTKTHKIEQYTFANRFLYQMHFLQSLLHQYVSALNNCNVELFMKIGTLYMEMAMQEKALDGYVELLRKDQLDENVNLDSLVKCVNYFHNLYSVHLSPEKVDFNSFVADYMKLIGASCDSIQTDISSVKILLENFGEGNEFGSLLKDICTYTDDVRQLVKKIRRRLPAEGTNSELHLPTDVQENLIYCRENVSQVMNASYLLRKSAVQQMAMSGDIAHINTEKLKELAHESTDKAYGKDDSGPDCMRLSMNLVMTHMNTLSGAMQEGEYEVDNSVKDKVISPVYLRALAIKDEAKDLENLKFKLDAREGDIFELKKMLKMKSDELSEMHVRKEMAEKKLEIATKDGDERVDRIQRQLDEAKMLLKKKEKEFEETCDHLQADIDALEAERGELKEKLKMSKKVILENISKTPSSLASLVATPTSPTLPGSAPLSISHTRDSTLLSQQVEDLQLAMKHLKNENNELQYNKMWQQMASLTPLKVPKKQTGLSNTTGLMNMLDLDKEGVPEQFRQLYKKSNVILKELHAIVLPTVVDITKRKPGTEPTLEKASVKNYLIERTAKQQMLQSEVEKLMQEVAILKSALKSGSQINADFSAFPTPSFVKAQTENKKLMAKISIPQHRIGDARSSVPLLLNMIDLRQLHEKVMC